MIHSHIKEVNVCDLPGKLILLDVKHGVFNRFVHERVHAGDEENNRTKQRLSIFGQKLLGVSIVTKLILGVKLEYLHMQPSTQTHTNTDSCQCFWGLTWSSGDLRLRSEKASPSCFCVCII